MSYVSFASQVAVRNIHNWCQKTSQTIDGIIYFSQKLDHPCRNRYPHPMWHHSFTVRQLALKNQCLLVLIACSRHRHYHQPFQSRTDDFEHSRFSFSCGKSLFLMAISLAWTAATNSSSTITILALSAASTELGSDERLIDDWTFMTDTEQLLSNQLDNAKVLERLLRFGPLTASEPRRHTEFSVSSLETKHVAQLTHALTFDRTLCRVFAWHLHINQHRIVTSSFLQPQFFVAITDSKSSGTCHKAPQC